MLFNHTAFGQLHQHLRQRNGGAVLRGQRHGIRCPQLGFLLPTVQWSYRRRCPEPRLLGWDHRLSPSTDPVAQHLQSTIGASIRRIVSIPLATGAQFRPPAHLSFAMRLTSFARGGENVNAACLIAAHCALIRVNSCASASTATSELTSVAVWKFCGARVLVCKICTVAPMLHESIWSEARVVSALCGCVLLQSACAIPACVRLVGQQIAHVQSQELQPRTDPGWLQAQLTPLPRRQSLVISVLAATMSPHQQRGASQTHLQQAQLGVSQKSVACCIRCGNACYFEATS